MRPRLLHVGLTVVVDEMVWRAWEDRCRARGDRDPAQAFARQLVADARDTTGLIAELDPIVVNAEALTVRTSPDDEDLWRIPLDAWPEESWPDA